MHMRPKYSPEQTSLQPHADKTLVESIDAIGRIDNVRGYLYDAYANIYTTPQFARIVGLAERIEDVYGTHSRVADAFCDGAVVGIDYTLLFLPHMSETFDTKLKTIIENYRHQAGIHPRLQNHPPEERFARAIRMEGRQFIGEYAPEYGHVLDAVADTRGYRDEQVTALYEGLGFVMEQAAWAYRTDLKVMKKLAVDMADDVNHASLNALPDSSPLDSAIERLLRPVPVSQTALDDVQ